MALIKCPECGKENVSDSAKMCPNCGYNIREHFDKLKEQDCIVEKDLGKSEDEKQWEEWEKQWEDNELKEIKMPPPPKPIDFILPFIICLIIGLMCFFSPEPLNVIGFIFFLILGICLGIYFVNSADKKYQQASNDFEEYKLQIIEEKKEKLQLEIMTQQLNESSQPKCPTCGSTNISKIGAIERGVSVAALGLFSKKINKSFKCNHCGYTW